MIGKRSQNNTNSSVALPNFVLSKYLFYFVAKIQEMMKNHGIYFNLKTVNSAAPLSPTPPHPPPMPLFQGISKRCVFHKKGESLFFVTFDIIISHIFPEDFMEISKIIQNIRRFSYSQLTIFINFFYFLAFSSCKETNGISLKETTSAFFFIFNVL